ncbi:DegT/DnrJ/EryC1/StrS family aminotransferase [Pedobacter chinensis]|uniref:DegT/DnrJ/EryC1/StrS family aminotransferase n=1 Tax=Pedobacter chinensis TaxID=2282421 RepID=A0A369PU59_9SPHI|nr:DegT/DnrJ/EryC1/StrS family aminotransferase [Pedobacter chinensis]RDC55822.1 DegT/DnrJ/EryC1/StrS family aminotransferase [Pedobacter chinensis]
MINVTKTFLPPFEEYTTQLKRAWDKAWITNNGELAHELEELLKKYLNLDHLLYAANGTIVLQLALKALEITGEVITTPFSYVATTTALLWENCTPVFVDINDRNFCIDENKIEAAITPKTQAILATHVYGHPCNIAAIEKIASKHRLKVIYDAAHAFGTQYNGNSVFNYGDVSTCSFHATKVFHTGEGGCMVAKDPVIAEKLMLYRQFGHIGEDYYTMGINAKNSEMHAAMGLCNLKYIDDILLKRKQVWEHYAESLKNHDLQILEIDGNVSYNYAYFPVVFTCEEQLLEAVTDLNAKGIIPRRYFNPSLNKLPYVDYAPCPVAESIASRVLCLPLFYELATEDQDKIINSIVNTKSIAKKCA